MGCPEKDCCANNPGNDAISFPGTHGHDTPWKFYNHLIGHVPEDLVVRDYCLGTHWSYVEADCGMGISFTCKGGAKRKHTMDLRGLPLRAVAELAKSWCFEEASLGVAALNANSAKLLRLWFPGTANSFAMGVYTAGMSAGAALAIWYGSRVAAIQDAWWFSFGLMAVGVVAWFAVHRKHPDGEHRSVEPVGTYLRVVARNWHVWAVAIVALLVFGMTNVNGSYMVAAVTALMGDPSLTAVAGDLSTLNTVIACVASMALPVVFAKLFKNMRAPFIACLAGTAVCFALVFFLPYGPITWVLFCIQPVLMASVMPFTKMLPTLLPSVRPEHYGVVGGIQATFQNFGMFLIASYVISPLAIAATGAVDGVPYYQGVYVATAVLCLVAAASLFLFPNVRSSVARKIADEQAAAPAERAE